MNRFHRWYCRSAGWRKRLDHTILPWSLDGVELGDEVLEVGPGPGLTTDWLRVRSKHLTCVEMDFALARSLERRLADTNVSVRCADGTAMPFPKQTFSTAVCFTVLHHLPSPAMQDRLFAEVFRVLRPGGIFAGTDSTESWFMRVIHLGDTMVLVDPAALPARLESAGFRSIEVALGAGRFRFLAHRPLSHRYEDDQLNEVVSGWPPSTPHTKQ